MDPSPDNAVRWRPRTTATRVGTFGRSSFWRAKRETAKPTATGSRGTAVSALTDSVRALRSCRTRRSARRSADRRNGSSTARGGTPLGLATLAQEGRPPRRSSLAPWATAPGGLIFQRCRSRPQLSTLLVGSGLPGQAADRGRRRERQLEWPDPNRLGRQVGRGLNRRSAGTRHERRGSHADCSPDPHGAAPGVADPTQRR